MYCKRSEKWKDDYLTVVFPLFYGVCSVAPSGMTVRIIDEDAFIPETHDSSEDDREVILKGLYTMEL